MINRVILTGRPTKKPVLRHTSSGISVTQCNLAVDRQYTNSNGERGADFISLVLWRKNAENFEKFVDKGQLIGIDGRLQSRSYENKDGQKVYVTEVVVDHFSFLESKRIVKITPVTKVQILKQMILTTHLTIILLLVVTNKIILIQPVIHLKQ